MSYNHRQIEKKWQTLWEKQKLYATSQHPKKKQYILDMFPYTSAAGLHVGHPEGYTATDIYTRYLRMNGFDALHPMGWDAFGLPAENYAIKTGVHPVKTTAANVKRFREQIKMLGLSYDWDREIDTSAPAYYQWTQWLFLKLYEKGLAYRKEANVNWCPKDQTVLANEQVVNGHCERCGSEVVQKLTTQWFLKITDYAEELLSGLNKIDWPEPIKLMQKNWIGKSEGALIKFPIFSAVADRFSIEVFTTRPDTIFGGTYVVVAPEHQLIENFKFQITNFKEVENYLAKTKKKTELQRTALEKEKTGVELKGVNAINPATKEKIPVWIADFVLVNYGTGAVFADAHDERDFAFAKKYKIQLRPTLKPADGSDDAKIRKLEECFTGDGILYNSGQFDGLTSAEARKAIVNWLEKEGSAKAKIQYKLRDWLISRQRYWGAPIPMIHCVQPNGGCGIQPVPEKDLPVKLPTDVDFRPTGESPLARSKTFHKVKCPKCGQPARRDTDTMDTFVDSAWYWLRYTDSRNTQEFAAKKEIEKWCPVDIYVGGADHAVLHLLYSRFFSKVLRDLGYLKFDEPFLKLKNQGVILGPDNQKMSKSKGNVINPDDVVDEFGADALRMYEMFMGPLEDSKPWSTDGIRGVRRFLDKVWRVVERALSEPFPGSASGRESGRRSGEVETLLHKTIKKVTDDILNFKFNTAVSALMILANDLEKATEVYGYEIEILLKLLAPFAPHLAEELWHNSGHKASIHLEPWPEYNSEAIKDQAMTIVVQVNGHRRGTITVLVDTPRSEIESLAKTDAKVQKYLQGHISNVIYVSGRIINFVTK